MSNDTPAARQLEAYATARGPSGRAEAAGSSESALWITIRSYGVRTETSKDSSRADRGRYGVWRLSAASASATLPGPLRVLNACAIAFGP